MGECTVVVAHSTRAFARDNLAAARLSRQTPEEHGFDPFIRALASRLHVPEQVLRNSILDSKVVHWYQGQVRKLYPGQQDCLVMPDYKTKLPQPLLALCGDYFIEASFSGCSRSARATANALMDWVQTRLAT